MDGENRGIESFMQALVAGTTAELLLNGVVAGKVTVQGINDSWGHGLFEPAPSFARFAPLFGGWSLLMHADEDSDKMSDDLAEELRTIESTMAGIRAAFRVANQEELPLALVNIDGPLVEWKYA
jgi:hypothetical protein